MTPFTLKFASSCLLAVALGAGAPVVLAQQERAERGAQQQGASSAGQLEKADARSMREMAEANLAEVAAGKMAAGKASSDEVKKYAQHMVDDHGKQLQELQALAAKKGVELPSEPSKQHQAAMKKLESASGDQFDRAYMEQMVRDHRDTLKLVERTAKRAKDTELKASAEKAAPDVRKHLEMAQQIAGAKGASSGASREARRSDARSGNAPAK